MIQNQTESVIVILCLLHLLWLLFSCIVSFHCYHFYAFICTPIFTAVSVYSGIGRGAIIVKYCCHLYDVFKCKMVV